ncbi:Lrp/AsnC family transcriptional regulator [Alteromonas sp. 1_MG-2023]|jgi:DNA-binding Lrp family transcriptional regulator|uniref:Lrp/AsnC family transcriptional regulator n=1 Tax=Alteromonas sp. 1_MG-2023 TaxID=3062669 RepID=UPI0026E17C69|nr:Lrp/AsnC family transcriptional regulator [Alteromonas sp. 1_MG-2023]MDO6476752.1 Lrp/AsnC family transcriptional regulator [Alteromonas sp. 1_MG-2023]
MDAVDRKILYELQKDGRLTLSELAERVNLSKSPCHRRLKELEKSKAILGYRAEVAADKVGLTFSALVFVTMKDGDKNALIQFEKSVEDIPQIVQAQRLFGTPDYQLHVVTKDLAAFQQLYDDKLSALPSVQRLTSTIVMKDIVQARSLYF